MQMLRFHIQRYFDDSNFIMLFKISIPQNADFEPYFCLAVLTTRRSIEHNHRKGKDPFL